MTINGKKSTQIKICHVNLAKGYRGGERQTEMLVKALSERGLPQKVIARHNSPLIENLSGFSGIELVGIRKPYLTNIMSCRGVDLIHVHETIAAQFVFFFHFLTNKPYIITRRILRPPNTNFFTRAVYSRAATIVTISRAIKQNLLGFDPRLDLSVIPDMASHIPHNVSNAEQLKKKYAGKFLVGHVGALVNKDKGQYFLVKAARALKDEWPGIHFLLLGTGRDEKKIRKEAEGLTNIEFLGFRDNVGDYLALFDLFIFPSLMEGLGSTLLDAMEYGLPIIATNVGGIPDIVKDNQNGVLIPSHDSVAIEKAIVDLYNNKLLRERLSCQAKEFVKTYFPDNIAKRYIELYQGITEAI